MVPNMKTLTVNRKIHIAIPIETVVSVDIIDNKEKYKGAVLFLHQDFPVFSLILKAQE